MMPWSYRMDGAGATAFWLGAFGNLALYQILSHLKALEALIEAIQKA